MSDLVVNPRQVFSHRGSHVARGHGVLLLTDKSSGSIPSYLALSSSWTGTESRKRNNSESHDKLNDIICEPCHEKTCILQLQTINAQISCATAHGDQGYFVGCLDMSLVVRKPVFGVSDQVRHKPG